MNRIAVFDLDGTLVDSAADIHAALDRLMAGLGLPGFTRPEVIAMIGDHRNDVQAAAGARVPCIFAGWGYGPVEMANGAPIAAHPGDLPKIMAAILA